MDTSAKRPATSRPEGWIITCPKCGHDWKLTRCELERDTGQVCPTCLDNQLPRERRKVRD